MFSVLHITLTNVKYMIDCCLVLLIFFFFFCIKIVPGTNTSKHYDFKVCLLLFSLLLDIFSKQTKLLDFSFWQPLVDCGTQPSELTGNKAALIVMTTTKFTAQHFISVGQSSLF